MDVKNEKQLLIKTSQLPTVKQLERTIYQNFSTLYKLKVGWSPQRINCTIFQNYLVIVAEQALSPLEMNIKQSGQTNVLLKIRENIDQIISQELQQLIEKITGVEVIDLVCRLNLNSNRLMAIAMLAESPEVRTKHKVRS